MFNLFANDYFDERCVGKLLFKQFFNDCHYVIAATLIITTLRIMTFSITIFKT